MFELTPKLTRFDISVLALVFVFSILLRLFALLDFSATPTYPYLQSSDSAEFVSWAKDIAAGDIIGNKVFMKWPLYAYFLAVVFVLFKNAVFGAYILQAIIGPLMFVFVYFAAKKLFDRFSACLTVLLLASYGMFIFYSLQLTYVSVSLVLNAFLFLWMLRLEDDLNWRKSLITGIVLGICTLAQAGILPAGIIAMAWVFYRNKAIGNCALKNIIAFLLGFFMVIAPVTLRNYIVAKDMVFIAANTGINFYLGNNPEAQGVFSCPEKITMNQESMFRDAKVIAQSNSARRLKPSGVSSYWQNLGLRFIKQEPVRFAKLILRKISYLFQSREYVQDIEFHFIKDKIGAFRYLAMDLRFLLPLGMLGIFMNLKKIKKYALLYIVTGSLGAGMVVFFVSTRYRIALVPFLAIFAASGISLLWGYLRERKFKAFCFWCAILVFFSLFANMHFFAKSLVKEAYSSLDYHMLVAQQEEHELNYRQALQELDSIGDQIYASPRLNFRKGVLMFKLNDLDKAELYFKEVLKNNPLSVDSYYNLGLLYQRKLKTKDAIEMFHQALALDPDDIDAHYALGLAYKELGEKAKAKEELSLALKNISLWRKLDREIISKELDALR